MFAKWLVTAALLFAQGTRAADCTVPDVPPNVLFLICDDLNCDLGCYGHPTVKSPNIDRLAERGVRFHHAYCQYPLCGPSRASFMTGLYPDQTLIRKNAIYLREHVPNVQTVAQLFRRNGYSATRIGKIFHYNVPTHIGTGGHDDPYSWDYTFNPRGRDKDDESQIFTLKPGQYGATLSWLAAEGTDEEQTDGIAAIQAAQLLEQYAKNNRPFMLAVGLYRPHTPYVAPRKYFDMYPLETLTLPTVPDGYVATLPPAAQQTIRSKKEQLDLAADVARQALQAYYASITFADAQLGRILDTLQRTGLAQRTIVVFTSDHGYHMGEHGHWQKSTLFENAARVPLIFAGPGVTAKGQCCAAPVEMIDIYPTLAELVQMETPEYLVGVSLQPALVDATAQPRESALTQLNNGYSIRTPRYRYTEWGADGAEGIELYDHDSDPAEMRNLASSADHDTIRTELASQLRQRVQVAKKPPKGVRQIHFDNNRHVPQ